MKRLPPEVQKCSAVEKLLWLHVHANPGEHSGSTLMDDLGGSRNTWALALSALMDAGLLRVDVPSVGPKPGSYTALSAPLKGAGPREP